MALLEDRVSADQRPTQLYSVKKPCIAQTQAIVIVRPMESVTSIVNQKAFVDHSIHCLSTPPCPTAGPTMAGMASGRTSQGCDFVVEAESTVSITVPNACNGLYGARTLDAIKYSNDSPALLSDMLRLPIACRDLMCTTLVKERKDPSNAACSGKKRSI